MARKVMIPKGFYRIAENFNNRTIKVEAYLNFDNGQLLLVVTEEVAKDDFVEFSCGPFERRHIQNIMDCLRDVVEMKGTYREL